MKKLIKLLAASGMLVGLAACGKAPEASWNVKALNWLKDAGIDTVTTLESEALKAAKTVNYKVADDNSFVEVAFTAEDTDELSSSFLNEILLNPEFGIMDFDESEYESGYAEYTFFSGASEETGKAADLFVFMYLNDNTLEEDPRLVLNFSAEQLVSAEAAQTAIEAFEESLGIESTFFGEESLGDVSSWFILEDEGEDLLVKCIDLDGTAKADLLSIIDEDNNTIDRSVEKKYGMFVRSNDTNADGYCATAQCLSQYGSDFSMYIYEGSKFEAWPVDTIKAFVNGFETVVPSLDCNVMVMDESATYGYIDLLAMDIGEHGKAGSYDKAYYDALNATGNKWRIYETTVQIDAAGTKVPGYIAYSKEVVNDKAIQILFLTINNESEFLWEISLADNAPYNQEIVNQIVNTNYGFTVTVPTPSADNAFNWGEETDYTTDNFVWQWCDDYDEGAVEAYIALFSEEDWTKETEERTISGIPTKMTYLTLKASATKDLIDYTLTVIVRDLSGYEFDVMVEVDPKEGAFNSAYVNKLVNTTWGFTTVVPTADGNNWVAYLEGSTETSFAQYTEAVTETSYADYLAKFDSTAWDVKEEELPDGATYKAATVTSKEKVTVEGKDYEIAVELYASAKEFDVTVSVDFAAAPFFSDLVNKIVNTNFGFTTVVPTAGGQSWKIAQQSQSSILQYTSVDAANEYNNYVKLLSEEDWNIETETFKKDEVDISTTTCISKETVTSKDGLKKYAIELDVQLQGDQRFLVNVSIFEVAQQFNTTLINTILDEQGFDESVTLDLSAFGAIFTGVSLQYYKDYGAYVVNMTVTYANDPELNFANYWYTSLRAQGYDGPYYQSDDEDPNHLAMTFGANQDIVVFFNFDSRTGNTTIQIQIYTATPVEA